MLIGFKYHYFVNKMSLPYQYLVLCHVVFLVECINYLNEQGIQHETRQHIEKVSSFSLPNGNYNLSIFELPLKCPHTGSRTHVAPWNLGACDIIKVPVKRKCGLYPHATFQVISFNNPKDIHECMISNLLKCCTTLLTS